MPIGLMKQSRIKFVSQIFLNHGEKKTKSITNKYIFYSLAVTPPPQHPQTIIPVVITFVKFVSDTDSFVEWMKNKMDSTLHVSLQRRHILKRAMILFRDNYFSKYKYVLLPANQNAYKRRWLSSNLNQYNRTEFDTTFPQ